MMTDQEELWLLHYQKAKKAVKVDNLWKGIQTAVMDRLGVHVGDSWLKYLLYIFKVDETSAYLMYKTLSEDKTSVRINACVADATIICKVHAKTYLKYNC